MENELKKERYVEQLCGLIDGKEVADRFRKFHWRSRRKRKKQRLL